MGVRAICSQLVSSFLYSLNPLQTQLIVFLYVKHMDYNSKYPFGSLPSCIQSDVFRSLYVYVLVNVHGQLYAMMSESERVT